MKNWQKLSSALRADNAGKRDIFVQNQFLSYDAHTRHITFPERVGGAFVRAQLGSSAFRQLCARLNMPHAFLSGPLAKSPKLVSDVVNFSLRDQGEDSFLWRTKEAYVRAVLSDQYATIDNTTIVDAVADCLDELPHQVRGFSLSDDLFFLKVTFDTTELADPSASALNRSKNLHTLKSGFVLKNSETGVANAEFLPFVFRASCTNDAVLQSQKFSVRHIRGKKKSYQRQLVRGISRAFRDGRQTIQTMLDTQAIPVMRPLQAIENICRDAKVSADHREEVESAFEIEPVRTAWGVSNAFTLGAQAVDTYTGRFRLELVGGELFEQKSSYWQHIQRMR